MQNAAARVTLNLPPCTHITPHLKELHWLPIHKQALFKLLTHTYKALHNIGPTFLNNCINFHKPTRHLRSAGLLLAHTPRTCRTRSSGRAFYHLAPKAWNDLPLHIKAASSVLEFHKKLKALLFT